MSILVRFWQGHFREKDVSTSTDAERIKQLEELVQDLAIEKTELITRNASLAYELNNMVGYEKRSAKRAKRWAFMAAGLALLLAGMIPLMLDAAHLLHLIAKPHIYTRLFIMGSLTIIGAITISYGWLKYR